MACALCGVALPGSCPAGPRLTLVRSRAQVHFDLKSPNVLLGRDNVAKVADVGLAKILQKDYVSSLQSCGTFAWSVSAAKP